MTNRKDPTKDMTPSVATYADYEVITPPHRLRKAVKAATDGDDDPIARADAALKQLSSEFGTWMQAECDRLEAARQQVAARGLDEKTHDELFRAAHDIRGEAATFGFPILAGPADSLCRLLEHTPEHDRIPLALVDQHVDAVRAIAREYSRPDLVEMANALTVRLRDVTNDFLRRENSFRPDYLENIFAPPIAPGVTGK
ncbi:MAG TPA: Hpt domain-containing protein [Xanthobacteraceae bacterium]|jgi:HPt (histidine-containing phosphotransfer) domain-containing protein|nr:Hpt domain-containing protein [Xanthobacteraceae bacterium]